MSQARGNGQNGGHFYSNITQPVKIDCSFVVNSSDSGGAGITSLKSNGYVQSVFMHTSATPASGSPNPAAGNVLVVLKSNYNKFLECTMSIESPVTGSALTATVNHVAYIITALGTATAAQWLAAGVPPGITPVVGLGFIAIATATIGGSATVKAVTPSGVLGFELIGDPSLSGYNTSIAANNGARLVGQFLDAAGALASPADSSIVNLSFMYDASSVSIDGL